jgi:hypothetical protein
LLPRFRGSGVAVWRGYEQIFSFFFILLLHAGSDICTRMSCIVTDMQA